MAGISRSSETSTLLSALGERADQLRARSVEDACSGAFWRERFGERGARRIEEDAGHHLSQLTAALEFEAPSILARYAVWLQQVLTNRGMCSRHLAEHFQALGRAAQAERLPGAPIVQIYLQAAIDALNYRSGPARAVLQATDSLTASLLETLPGSNRVLGDIQQLPRDIGYLLSYLADSVALEQSNVFVDYVVWIDGYFSRRGRPAGYLSSILHELEAALHQVSDEARAKCQQRVSSARAALNVTGD